MSKYKIVYIDEEEDKRRNVKRAFMMKNSSSFTVKGIHPKASLDETIDEIFFEDPDVIISDYNFANHDPYVKYNGDDLILKAIERSNVICFVLTGYPEKAIPRLDDGNIVHDKNSLNDDKITFVDRVLFQLQHRDRNRETIQRRFDELIQKQITGELEAFEELELIELDDKIEMFTRKHPSPRHLKEEKYLQSFSQLLRETEALIKDCKPEERGINDGCSPS